MMTLPASMPHYYTSNEVKALRDKDRRRYRANVIWLVLYQVIVLGPIRVAFDTATNNPRFGDLSAVKVYIVPAMIALVLLMWILGLTNAFRRKY